MPSAAPECATFFLWENTGRPKQVLNTIYESLIQRQTGRPKKWKAMLLIGVDIHPSIHPPVWLRTANHPGTDPGFEMAEQ